MLTIFLYSSFGFPLILLAALFAVIAFPLFLIVAVLTRSVRALSER